MSDTDARVRDAEIQTGDTLTRKHSERSPHMPAQQRPSERADQPRGRLLPKARIERRRERSTQRSTAQQDLAQAQLSTTYPIYSHETPEQARTRALAFASARPRGLHFDMGAVVESHWSSRAATANILRSPT